MANTKPSPLEQIRKLRAEEAKLLEEAKADALARAGEVIAELKELGFHYSLVEVSETTSPTSPTGRRTGIRDRLLDIIRQHPGGIGRAEILTAMKVKGNKRGEGSVSNALANMKKQGQIDNIDGLYTLPQHT